MARAPQAPICPATLFIELAISAARPDSSMAALMAKAQAMVISMSQLMYLVYFFGGNSLSHAITTAVTEAKKNMSIFTPGKRSLTAGSSPMVAPAIIMMSSARAVHFFHTGMGRVGISRPLVIIRNTEESPQVRVKASSASSTSVSPCCRRTSPRFSVITWPPCLISFTSAP